MTRAWAINAKTAAKFEAAGRPVFVARGKSVFMASGKDYVCVDYCQFTIQ